MRKLTYNLGRVVKHRAYGSGTIKRNLSVKLSQHRTQEGFQLINQAKQVKSLRQLVLIEGATHINAACYGLVHGLLQWFLCDDRTTEESFPCPLFCRLASPGAIRRS